MEQQSEVNRMSDLISRQAAINAPVRMVSEGIEWIPVYHVEQLPSAQPEIIRCNVCRHWHQTTGEMKGFGLGDCDYLEKKLVTCNGYCYWAERKDDE